MENLVVATFETIADATNGLNKLKELERSGDITIYNLMIVRKISNNRYQLLHQEGVNFGRLPADNHLTTLLCGILDRPLGMATDLFSGLLRGPIRMEEQTGDVSDDFLDQFNQELQVSSFSILLDAEEDEPSFIDEYMRSFHGVAFRSNIVDLYYTFLGDRWLQRGTDREKVTDSLKKWVTKVTRELNVRIRLLEERIREAGYADRRKLASRKLRLEQKVKKLNDYIN
jgi:hypothetical protein